MKRAKITFSPDLVKDPPMRIVKVSPSGQTKTIVGINKVDPYFKHNPYSYNYEIITEFFNERDGEAFRLVGHRLDWERLIAKVQSIIKQMPNDK